jgi:SAM-dependent methyltransferase
MQRRGRMTSFDPQNYWETRHTKRYGPESVGYAGLGVPYNEWMYRVRGKVVTRELRAAGIDLSSRDVLDVGSGTGFYVRLLRKLGARSVTGSDFAPFALQSLRARFPENRFVQLDISANLLPLELGHFDVITAFDILYHIVEDERYAQAFRNVAALLRPGGYFIFSENFMRGSREAGLHQVSRSDDEIVALLRENGFSIERRAPVFLLMNRPLKSSSRILEKTWSLVEHVTARRDRPWLGAWLGAALYPVEISSVRFMRTGPTTEMMICRKKE